MALIGRLFAIFFGFLLACAAAGLVVVFALLIPELKDASLDGFNAIIGIGFVVISGFALLPAVVLILVTEAFYIRHILAYAVAGGLTGLFCFLFIPIEAAEITFTGIVRRHLEVMVGAGVVGGVVYWMVAGRNAGFWRGEPAK